jgi:hypothetical protein
MGSPGTLQLGDRLTRITDGGTKRVVTFDLTLTIEDAGGNVTNRASSEVDDTLMAGPPDAIVAEELHQQQQLAGQGMSAQVALNEMLTPAMPMVDLTDRTDLDQLPVGHKDEQTVQTTVSATATATISGMSQTNTTTATSSTHTVWTIMQQIPSMMVLGKTYSKVVEVVVDTDSTDTSTNMVTTSTQTLWLAAGIGQIKSEANNALTPTPITAELVDTNLSAM